MNNKQAHKKRVLENITFILKDFLQPVMALVRSKRSGRKCPPKKHQKLAPLSKILLYFFIVAS